MAHTLQASKPSAKGKAVIFEINILTLKACVSFIRWFHCYPSTTCLGWSWLFSICLTGRNWAGRLSLYNIGKKRLNWWSIQAANTILSHHKIHQFLLLSPWFPMDKAKFSTWLNFFFIHFRPPVKYHCPPTDSSDSLKQQNSSFQRKYVNFRLLITVTHSWRGDVRVPVVSASQWNHQWFRSLSRC